MGKGENAGYQHFLLFPQCFQKLSFLGSLKVGIVWERVNPFPNKPWVLCACSTGLLKTLWEKEELLVTSNFFSFSYSVFYPFVQLSTILSNLKLSSANFFSSEESKIVVWERVNSLSVKGKTFKLGKIECICKRNKMLI